jgi:hypothetical protein
MEKKYVFETDEVNDEFIDYLYSTVPKGKNTNTEGKSITLFLDGHGLELFDENFKDIIDEDNNAFSDAFKYKILQSGNPVRILSKAGKPKTCAWNLNQCTPNKNSSLFLLDYIYSIFKKGNELDYSSLNILQVLSIFYKKSYPSIIKLLNKEKYKVHPEERVSYSPDYETRYNDFQKVKKSIEENKFSLIKKPAFEKIYFLRNKEEEDKEKEVNCIHYAFEIIDFTGLEDNNIFKKGDNWANNTELYSHFKEYINTLDYLSEEEITSCHHFLDNVFFEEYINLSEIIEFFTLLGFETINIIDNTCRVYKKTREFTEEPRTSSIERKEELISNLGKGLSRKTKKKTLKKNLKKNLKRNLKRNLKKTKKK